MPRHLVCLGFDLVASRDCATMVTDETRDADDISVAAARVLDLLSDRGLVATWFVPGEALALTGALAERLVRDGHEVALLAPTSPDVAAVGHGREQIRQVTGTSPRGFRVPGGDVDGWGPWLAQNGFRYEASRTGLDWWPRGRCADSVVPGPSAADLITMPIVLALGGDPPSPARAMMQDWSDELLQMRDSVNFGVLTCAMPLAVIGRGAMLRAFSTFLDTAKACGAVVVPFEAAARAAAERIRI
ncbi:polysaccharide deacetylase family protein [Rhodoplanes sp. SY1]|uniref:polysaccharide deacetylase family protein n=1 Tax=Rhodoplanes sp. SY1 TaxID=3166646 RepID=UPI0038B522DA